jgi:rhamnulokinase
MVSDKPVLDAFALKNGFTNERGFDNSYRILKNIVGLWLIQGLQSSFKNKYSYNEIEELVSNTKSQSVIIPDSEIFYNPVDMKEAFDEFLRISGQSLPETPGQYFKIAYDSLCCSFRDNMDKLETMLNTNIEAIHLIGGGGQSKYLCRQTANICRMKVIAGPVEGSTIGNILVQAIALKVISNIEEGRKMVKNSFDIIEYIPKESDGETDKLYEIYQKINH